MKNKKNTSQGFTLVEILAVILILGLISVMIVPRILSKLEERKEEVSELTLQTITSAVELYLQDYEMKYPKIDGNVYCITLQELVDNNRLTEPIIDIKTGTSLPLTNILEVRIENQKYKYTLNSTECIENRWTFSF